MLELQQERDKLVQLLEQELATCKRSGVKLAENEAEYRKALRIEILEARSEGTPVSIISDVCRGIDYIADLKQARDNAEAIYKASQEAINVYKLRLRMVEADIARIWASGGYSEH